MSSHLKYLWEDKYYGSIVQRRWLRIGEFQKYSSPRVITWQRYDFGPFLSISKSVFFPYYQDTIALFVFFPNGFFFFNNIMIALLIFKKYRFKKRWSITKISSSKKAHQVSWLVNSYFAVFTFYWGNAFVVTYLI